VPSEDQVSVNKNQVGASKFYLQSPLRFMYFRWASICFAIDLVGFALIAIKYRDKLDLFTWLCLLLALGSIGSLLRLVFLSHAHLRSLLESEPVGELELRSNLNAVFCNAAVVTNRGLLLAALSVMGFFGLFSRILQAR
jgi:hypothetical protein